VTSIRIFNTSKPRNFKELNVILNSGLFVCEDVDDLSDVAYIVDVDLHNRVWSIIKAGGWCDAMAVQNQELVNLGSAKEKVRIRIIRASRMAVYLFMRKGGAIVVK
jgi:hypothetical protein